MLTKGFAFIVVILIADCYLGARYKVGLGMWLIAFLYMIINTVLNIGLEIALVFFWMITSEDGILVSEVGNLLLAYAVPISTVLNVISYLFFLLVFLIMTKEKKFHRRFFKAAGISFLPGLLFFYIDNLPRPFFSALFGSLDEYQRKNFLSNTYVSVLTIAFAFVAMLTLILILYFAVYRRGIRMKVSAWIVVLFIVWEYFFTFLAMIPYLEVNFDYSQQIMNGYLVVFLTIIGISAPVITVFVLYSMRLRERTVSQESYLQAELEYIEQYKRKEHETRAFRHDMINQLALLEMNLSAGRDEECKEHLTELLGKAREFSPRFNTGDEMLDCIVSMKNEKMEEAGVTFSCDGVCDGGLKMRPMDLCVIFANAMDNAIEATLAEREKGLDVPMNVDFKITRTDSYFVFKLKNPCPEDLDAESLFDPNVIYTSKKDKRHHGFGTKNLLHTVTSYGGMVRARREGRVFELGITLPRNA